jgi:caffeoyl-CoA O-methyltransferase
MKNILRSLLLAIFMMTAIFPEQLAAQSPTDETDLDRKVRQFLSEQSGQWHDWNVPAVDGKKLFDLVVEGHYKSALEIGTSTGFSGIYIAWALSKTGGKLITIEIDEGRYETALKNFRKA